MNLTTENYYTPEADAEYMSVSQYKRWISCPAAANAQYVAGIWKPESTDALLHGSYFHALFDGTAENFLADTPDLMTKKMEKTAPVKLLDSIFARVSQDSFFMNAVTGEHERIFTAGLHGVQWKCRIDVMDFDKFGGFLCDIKTVRDFAPVWNEDLRLKLPFYLSMKYDLQLAVYQKLIEIATGYKLSAYIAAVTKEAIPDYEVFDFNSDDMETHFFMLLNEVKTGVEQIQAIKSGNLEIRRCEKCDYCKQTKRLKTTTLARF